MGFTFSTHILENATTSTMAVKTALTLLVLFAIIITMESRTPLTKMAKMTKMNKVAKMGHQATLVQKVMDDCDFRTCVPMAAAMRRPTWATMETGLAAPTLTTSAPWMRTHAAIAKCQVWTINFINPEKI